MNNQAGLNDWGYGLFGRVEPREYVVDTSEYSTSSSLTDIHKTNLNYDHVGGRGGPSARDFCLEPSQCQNEVGFIPNLTPDRECIENAKRQLTFTMTNVGPVT